MEKILKAVDTNGEMKKKEIYKLLKTNSQKINSEISKKIKSFNKIDDFIDHYSNKTPLLEFLNCMEFNSSKNYGKIFSSFDSNIEQYISCLIQINIAIKLIFKLQEILNKIFISSKKYLLKLKLEQRIESVSQKNLFSFIKKLLNIHRTKTLRKFSNSSSILNKNTSVSVDDNLVYSQKFISNQTLNPFSNNDFGKTLKLLSEEPLTPKFGSNSHKNTENTKKENYQKICIKKDSSFTLAGEEEINSFKDNKSLIKSKTKNSIIIFNDKNEKKYENLLEMINDVYKKGIINSEEKIILKQLVIAKSKKLENLYYNIYKNKFIDNNVLRLEISNLLN